MLSMILELRIYRPVAGREEDLLARFRNCTMALFDRHRIRVTHFWMAQGTKELIYVCAWSSEDAMRDGWERFRQDPEWMRVKSESEIDGPIVASVESKVIEQADFFGG
jgi:heme-degrading monooxygenase HmoA